MSHRCIMPDCGEEGPDLLHPPRHRKHIVPPYDPRLVPHEKTGYYLCRMHRCDKTEGGKLCKDMVKESGKKCNFHLIKASQASQTLQQKRQSTVKKDTASGEKSGGVSTGAGAGHLAGESSSQTAATNSTNMPEEAGAPGSARAPEEAGASGSAEAPEEAGAPGSTGMPGTASSTDTRPAPSPTNVQPAPSSPAPSPTNVQPAPSSPAPSPTNVQPASSSLAASRSASSASSRTFIPAEFSSLYWFNTQPNRPAIQGHVLPVIENEAWLILPDHAPMDSCDGLALNQRELALRISIFDATKASGKNKVEVIVKRVNRVRPERFWHQLMSDLEGRPTPAAFHIIDANQPSPDMRPNQAFSRVWRRVCTSGDTALLQLCISGALQNEVKREVIQYGLDNQYDMHHLGARTHATSTRNLPRWDRNHNRDASNLFGRRVVVTAGARWEETEIKAGFTIKVVIGKILVFISKQQDARSDPAMILLSAGDSLFTGPGARLELYSVEPTIFDQQTFLDYRLMDWVKGSADRMIQLHTYYMAMALMNEQWTAALWNRSCHYAHDLKLTIESFPVVQDEELQSFRQLAMSSLKEVIFSEEDMDE